MRRLFILISMLIILFAGSVSAGTVSNTYYFSQPTIQSEGDYDRVLLPEGRVVGEPGEPALPRIGVSLLLPAGEEATEIQIDSGQKVELSDRVNVIPFQKEYPLSYDGEIDFTNPNPSIYRSDAPFPNQLTDNLTTHFLRGHGIAFLNVCPFEYHPQSGKLFYYPEIRVTVKSAFSPKASSSYQHFLRTDSETNQRIEALVDNSMDLFPFYGESIRYNRDGDYDYLIITNQTMQDEVLVLANYKNRCGILTEIALVSDILDEYSGQDDAEKIRNFIIDEYQNHNISYLLLAGDGDGNGGAGQIIQHRGLYASVNNDPEYDIPADIYFSHLDGNWNDDGDNRWGEPGEDDLLGEIYVGRVAADSETEMENFINKAIMYQNEPVVDDIEDALMVGEDLGWIPWGKDYKEEIRLGSSNWGYETEGFPPNFSVQTLYDKDDVWSAMGDLMPILNGGQNLVNHLGHANTTYTMKFYDYQINDTNCTNDGVNEGYYIIYTQGCYCGAFDNRTTSSGNYTSDCITEKWTVIENGAVAFISNSRYGWGNGSNTNGSSQYYDRQFFDALFGENISIIGETQQDSKEDNIPYINNGANRWVHYCVNLLGEPTMDIWTADPAEIVTEHEGAFIIGAEEYEVVVTDDSGDAVENALVALSVDNICVGKGYTDATGTATIELFTPIEEPGVMDIVVTGHNLIPSEEVVDVISPEGPYLVYEMNTIDDTDGGNGDGTIDFNETIDLWISLENVGVDTASSVYAILSTEDEFVEVVVDSQEFGTIESGEIMESLESYVFNVAADCPDEHAIDFQLDIFASNYDENWDKEISMITQAPILVYQDMEIFDSDGESDIDPGETVEFVIYVHNEGTGEITNLNAAIASDDPYITISQDSAFVDTILGGETGALLPLFVLSADESCPDPHLSELTISLESENIYFSTCTAPLFIGGFTDDMESGVGDWTHYAVSGGFSDDWHQSDSRNHTTGGENSWKCGDTGSGNYGNLLDAGLVTPEIYVGQNAVLKFWQWIDAEVSGSYPGYAYDGGIVEISTDGGENWVRIDPVGGYPYNIREGGTPGPFPVEMPCFSGTMDWHQVEFNLANYWDSNCMFRFRFGSDGAVNAEGWYIDDVRITESMYQTPMYLQADGGDDDITLSWSAPLMAEPTGYNLYRGMESGEYDDTPVNYQPITELTFSDETVLEGVTYYYVVTALYEDDAESGYSNEANAFAGTPSGIDHAEVAVPSAYAMHQNYPNPFNPKTVIKYDLPRKTNVALKIYDISGKLVKTVVSGEMEAGYHSVIWDGKDEAGRDVNSGVYVYRLETEDFDKTRKCLLLK